MSSTSGPRLLPATVVVWGGLAVVGWTHVGYPVLARVVAALAARRPTPPPPDGDALPTLTVVVSALDEQDVITAKVGDCLAQDYPRERLDVLVVADGSTDATAERARRAGARVLHAAAAGGKSHAVNRGVSQSTSEIVCLTDANCALAPGALRALVAPFANPSVAVVSGSKRVVGAGARGGGEGLYWRLESAVKRGESVFGAVMGAPGELSALRRSDFRPIPPGIINDDYHLTCDALVRGLRVEYAPGAETVEEVSATVGDEATRRVRIAAGTWQTTLQHLALADPRRGPVALAFVSHRVLRSIVAPMGLVAVLLAAVRLAPHRPWGRALLAAQVGGYALGALGLVTDHRAAAVPLQFVLTNAASLRGGARFLLGGQSTTWERVRRGGWVEAAPAAAGDVHLEGTTRG